MDARSDSSYVVPLQISGKDLVTTTTFDIICPSTGQKLWSAASASPIEALQAVEAAQKALPSWTQTLPAERRDIFLRAADLMESRAEELAQCLQDETGAGRWFAKDFILPMAIRFVKDLAGRVVTVQGHVVTSEVKGKMAMILKEPYGVVLGIAPWNAPYLLGCRAIIYPLAAGNTVILKGSECCPRVWSLIGKIFTEAGLPSGTLNVIVHRPEDAEVVTRAIIEHPYVKKVSFTGSTQTGKVIGRIAGENLKPVLLELGGKASAIVLQDATIKTAAFWAATGAFAHSGQTCMATERILVHSSVADAFCKELEAAIHKNFTPAMVPVLINPDAVQRNKKMINEAIQKGAKVLIGQKDAQETSNTRMRPIVIGQVTKDMDLYYKESFGPSVSLLVFDTVDEAVQMANDTEYGLSCAIFTENLGTALKMAKRIETGAVHINSMTVHDEANLPHGGAKASGYGRFNGNWGIEEFLRLKSVTWME